MSVLFGIWNFNGAPIEKEAVSSADGMLASYAPDGIGHYSRDDIALVHHAFHTTAESRTAKQPFTSASGAVVTWDGRLDNREELIDALQCGLTNDSTDVEIVSASFDRWGKQSFAKLLGDWAIAIWNAKQCELILAKDFVGIRPLYYLVDDGQARWSSVLDPLVRLAGKKFEIDEQYIAGWLTMYPAADRTPYVNIRAVPPSCFVTVRAEQVSVTKYWDFDPTERIVYSSDHEYEEHFRSVFREAVRRRLRADSPICAELSGGMDSPSVTCMADSIACSSPGIPEIHTLSYFDNSEPHLDERPYFATVEEQRGRMGCHIDLAGSLSFDLQINKDFWVTPASVCGPQTEPQRQRSAFLESNGIHVVLSGTGGDEMTGGVPTAIPELQDLILQREFRQLATKLKLWALAKRKPWFYLAAEALAGFLAPQLTQRDAPPAWLRADFMVRSHYIRQRLDHPKKMRGPLPSFQENIATLDTLRLQMGTNELASNRPTETRYPFLDRTLLEFLFALPREQVVRPGYRRSLMRRALRGIVPPAILERRRKGYASRGPRLAISMEAARAGGLTENMLSSRIGIVEEREFRNTLLSAKNTDHIPLIPLSRTLMFEAWLRNLEARKLLVHKTTELPRERRALLIRPRASSVS